MNTKSNAFLETEPLGKLMGKYAVPCVISLLVAALYNIVDQIFIANADYLGSYGNAANTVVFPLTVVALSIAVLIGDGCCAFVSISLGVPFYMFGQAMNPIIRSDGSPQFAMASTLLGALVNIILDPVFIFVCKWGMMGYEGSGAGEKQLPVPWRGHKEIYTYGNLQLFVPDFSGHGYGGYSEYDSEIQCPGSCLWSGAVYPDSHGCAGNRDEILPDRYLYCGRAGSRLHPGGGI